MRAFKYLRAPDLKTAVSLLKEPGTEVYAGGTDLLGEMKRGIRTVDLLADLKGCGGMSQIEKPEGGGLKIGALAPVEAVANHPGIKEEYPILARAASQVGTPQLRMMGTVGGNLCQHPRCWYFRHSQFPCWLKEGEKCFAAQGRNHYHSILGTGVCHSVHPSDLAPVLIALDARAILNGAEGDREISLEELYKKPDPHPRYATRLKPGELISAIRVPARSQGTRAVFLKAMDRRAWSFALVSVAARFGMNGRRFVDGAFVLGGVAGIPWRARGAEEVLRGREYSGSIAQQAADAAVSGAMPLRDNEYKIPLAKGLVLQALHLLAGGEEKPLP
ncbi:MAG: FAD binding domain-containing protein [Planctomycetaceae bacterium]